MSTLITAKAAVTGGASFRSPSSSSRRRETKFRYSAVRMQTRFHNLIQEQGVVLMPGCYDALSAAIVQKTGFSAGFISGYALSASLLGKPDFGLLTPPEMAAAARTVCSAASLIPIIADADTGGGNALNVQRTIKDLIAAGAAGCFLEVLRYPCWMLSWMRISSLWPGLMPVQHQRRPVFQMPLQGLICTWRRELMLPLWRRQGTMRNSRRLDKERRGTRYATCLKEE